MYQKPIDVKIKTLEDILAMEGVHRITLAKGVYGAILEANLTTLEAIDYSIAERDEFDGFNPGGKVALIKTFMVPLAFYAPLSVKRRA